MKDRPWRKVISWTEGAGTDSMTLECGHGRTRNHRTTPPKRAQCLVCDQPL